MPKVICAAIECAHMDENHHCQLKEVSLSEHYVHTVYDGLKHFWTCKMYEQSEQSKRLERMFKQYLKVDGVESHDI